MEAVDFIELVDNINEDQVVNIISRVDPFEIYNDRDFYLRYRFGKPACREIIHILYDRIKRLTNRHQALLPEIQSLHAATQ
uniref:Uncharacterized protein n=1 Tax=Romanomermis culicivorax TaxID=13658 RepID=A0A915J0P0_ROMCU